MVKKIAIMFLSISSNREYFLNTGKKPGENREFEIDFSLATLIAIPKCEVKFESVIKDDDLKLLIRLKKREEKAISTHS